MPSTTCGAIRILLSVESTTSGPKSVANVYYNMSDDDDAQRGLRNQGPDWEFIAQPQPALYGGDGLASVPGIKKDVEVLSSMASRTASATESDPVTAPT